MIENTTQVEARGMTLSVRTEEHGDNDVIGEVITGDCYGLQALKDSGFNPKVVFDVGAHIGTFSSFVKHLWPEAEVYSFEPGQRSFELLSQNCPTCVLHNVAVRYDKSSVLTQGKGATGGGFITTKESFDAAAQAKHGQDGFIYRIENETVQTTTLEAVIKKHKITHIDLLKLDCEGSEFSIVQGMKPDTAKMCGNVLGEYHTELGFDYFKEQAERTFAHLVFYGGNGRAIGPFWSRKRA